MRTAKYTRIVVKIADREGITCRRAVKLYQLARRYHVTDLSRGLTKRVELALNRAAIDLRTALTMVYGR